MNQSAIVNRSFSIRRLAFYGLVIVSAKVFIAILYQYRWYFPADFDASPFLAGRRFTFTGIYPAAFYAHLLVGPLALILGTFLMLTGGKRHWSKSHRICGRTLFAAVILGVVPSGVVMADQAYGGVIAQWGFVVQSFLTGLTIAIAARYAMQGRLCEHRKWATRCYLLLWSPLLLRVIAGALIVTQTESESEWTYRFNAWASWIIPLILYECLSTNTARNQASSRQPSKIQPLTGDQA